MDEKDLCRLDRAGQQSDFFRAFSVVWILMALILMISGVVLWLYYRQQLLYLRKRGLMKISMGFIALAADLVVGPLDRAVPGRGSNVHSCPLLNITLLMTVPFYVIAGISQIILFRNRYAFYKALGKETAIGSEISSRQSYFRVFDSKLRRMQLFASEGFVAVAMVVLGFLVLGIIIAATASLCPEFGATDNCSIGELASPVVLAVLFPPVLLALFLCVYIHKQLKTFPDPFNLLGEIKTVFTYAFFFSLPGFALIFLNFGDPNGQEEVPFSYSVWLDAVFLWVFVYSVHYQIYKALQFDEVQLLYRDITLDTVLKDKVGRDLFKLHLTNEFALENLYFIEAVEAFRIVTPEKLEKEAENIFEMFFEEDILNVKWETEKTVREQYKQGIRSIDMFDAAFREIYQLTSRDSFARFQLSPDFETYIGLKNKVEVET